MSHEAHELLRESESLQSPSTWGVAFTHLNLLAGTQLVSAIGD